jgi:DNA-binding Lrp family transcriptional regulator
LVKIVYKFNGAKKESLQFGFCMSIFLMDSIDIVRYLLSTLKRNANLFIIQHQLMDMLDETDKRIIEILIENSRMSYADIARKLGISEATVFKRIKKLKDEGVIDSFTLQLDPNKVGRNVSLSMGLTVNPVLLEEIAKKLSNLDEVSEVFITVGEHNIIAHALLEDNDAFNDFLMNKIYKLEGITKIDTNIILKKMKARIKL